MTPSIFLENQKYKSIINIILVYSIIITFFIDSSFSQNTVFVESSQIGRGILRPRGNECFVITPYHVVEKSSTILNVYGSNATKSSCELLQNAPYDLAILRLDQSGGQECAQWILPKSYSQILNRNNNGFLEITEKSGSVRIIDVNIIQKDVEYISISPTNSAMIIVKGWSGSALFVNDGMSKVYLGMLSDVDDEGVGAVLRADVMMLTLSTFFNGEITKTISDSKKNINGLAYQEDKQIKCTITDYEQNGQSFKVKYTLVNLNSSMTSIEASFPPHYSSLVDQEGYVYNGFSIKMGNKENNTNLIYNTPINCELTFNVGANVVDKIEKLNIHGYSQDFTFLNINKNVTDLNIENTLINPKKLELDVNRNLAQSIDKGVKCVINHFDQNGSKGNLYFTLTNTSSSQSKKEVSIPAHYCRFQDQSGLEFKGNAIYLGNTGNNAQLISGINLKCKIEFTIGIGNIEKLSYLNIKGYENNFEFFGIPIVETESQTLLSKKTISSNSASVILPPKENLLGELTEGDVNIKISKFEQIGNKAILTFFLTNKNNSQQVLDFSSRAYQTELKDRKNNTYNATYIEIGSGSERSELILNTPVQCFAEFEVGMNQIMDISYLKISGSTGDFEFNGKKGKLGQPESLKSKKAADTKTGIIVLGGALLFDAALKKIDKNKKNKDEKKN